MSEQNSIQLDELTLTDELIASYLQSHPDFFLCHPQLLASMRLQQNQQNVTSLVAKQQQILREQNHQLQEEITHLLAVASHNENLFSLYSDLYLRLIDANSAEEILSCLENATTELLSLAKFKIWLDTDVAAPLAHHCVINADCQGVVNNRLAHSDFYFGRLQQSEQTRLFDTVFNGSVVLIKLQYQQQILGMIAIASQDAEHFDPNMDTLLLTQFTKLVAKLLAKHLAI